MSNWTPASLANLSLWLRADKGVTGTSTVTAWADQSANAFNLSGGTSGISLSSSGGPNSTPCIVFAAGTAATLTAAHQPVTGTSISIFAVLKISNAPPGTNYNPFVLGSATPISLGQHALSGARLFTIGSNTQTGGTGTTSFEAWGWTSSGGAQTLQVNGSTVALSGNIASATPDSGIALTNISTVSGSISELIVVNGLASAGDIANVNSYFTTRYGL